ncbi:hypothetical protein ACOMHN_027472 [Nucella lapillus]
MTLSTLAMSEEELSKLESQLSSTPTAQLVSRFPSLQELRVNMVSLSEPLLEALSAPGRRAPLCGLSIRHVDHRQGPNPHLVSFYLVTVDLPLLSGVLKPETPLVRLKVDCFRSDSDSLRELYQLCNRHRGTLQHFHLAIVSNREVLRMNQAQEGLERMVKRCTQLRHLLCSVEVREDLLVDLARLARPWKTFRFNPLRLVTSDKEDGSPGLQLSAKQTQFISQQKRLARDKSAEDQS